MGNSLNQPPTKGLENYRKLSVAPMMDWTDRHCRFFHRLFSPHALLYTEMVTTGALLHGNSHRFLDFDICEQPLALQLGGSNPDELAQCAKMAEQAGYQEVNLNIGCPSDRVQNGKIGACLMAEPKLVAQCVTEMNEKISIPVTIKTRIGIDDFDSEEFLFNFVETIAQAGCKVFIIHARKAILKGLSPKENRTIPPLNYERAYLLKKTFPALTIVLNGGVKTASDVKTHWQHVDGVMIGREAYHNPYCLMEIEQQCFNRDVVDRVDILKTYLPYVEQQLVLGVPLQRLTRHLLGLFAGQPNGKYWRRFLSSEHVRKKGAGPEVFLQALDSMRIDH